MTTKELAISANGPTILLTGIANAADLHSSPPVFGNTIILPIAFTGGEENYVVLLTPLYNVAPYVSQKLEDDNGNFSGFSFVADDEGDVMYLVTKIGIKPT